MGDTRRCIKCDSDQQRVKVGGVEIDRCPNCGGLWLDDGEIDRLTTSVRASGGAEIEEMIRKLSGSDPAPNGGNVATDAEAVRQTPCPACRGKLTAALIGGVTIALCNSCQGMFLDAGELQHAMKLVGRDEATTIVALAGSVTTSGSIG